MAREDERKEEFKDCDEKGRFQCYRGSQVRRPCSGKRDRDHRHICFVRYTAGDQPICRLSAVKCCSLVTLTYTDTSW